MKIYLSGPMSGKLNNNEAAFRVAKMNLEVLGHEVTSPTELDHNAGVDLSRDATAEEYEVYMGRDLEIVPDHEAVVFLPGWQRSGGAGREGREAIAHGLKLYFWVAETPQTLYPLSEEEFMRRSTTKRVQVAA